jgi:hypothetical protein
MAASKSQVKPVTKFPTSTGLVRIVKRKLKKIQYRPHLIDGCLAPTGLQLEPW